jgi:hypothetical protein
MSLMVLDKAKQAGFKMDNMTMIWTIALGQAMKVYGMVRGFTRAPHRRKRMIKMLVLACLTHKVLLSWSDMQTLGVLPQNFPAVLPEHHVATADVTA